MIFEYSDYRSFLKSTLASRISRNPSYSLRSLARDMKLSPTLLSLVIRGQKNISVTTALKLAFKLGLNEKETQYLCALVQIESADNDEMKENIESQLRRLRKRRQVKNLDCDEFKVISEWYHFPILEMTRLDKLELSPEAAAERLGLKTIEAEAAIERLLRLGLLIREPLTNRLRKGESTVLVSSKESHQALQSFHKQMLQKALASVETQQASERFLGCDVYAIDPEQVPEARQRIEEFMNDMQEFFASGKRRSEVYQLGLQLTRITKRKGMDS